MSTGTTWETCQGLAPRVRSSCSMYFSSRLSSAAGGFFQTSWRKVSGEIRFSTGRFKSAASWVTATLACECLAWAKGLRPAHSLMGGKPWEGMRSGGNSDSGNSVVFRNNSNHSVVGNPVKRVLLVINFAKSLIFVGRLVTTSIKTSSLKIRPGAQSISRA